MMKNIWKTVPVLAAAALVFAACAPDEKLDLAGFPETTMGLTISDVKPAAPLLELTAVYNSEGKLVLDGELTHNYLFRLNTANSQDMKLRVEPIIVNIPTDKVTISETQFTLSAGEIEVPVNVTFTDEDFNFAAPDKDAKTYEIGVRLVDVQGYNTVAELGSEAKVVINKERYEARVSLVDATGGHTATFDRGYWEGVLNTTDPLTYTFKAALDKPASEAITLTFATEGIPQAFADDITIAPATVTIPAGAVESEEITWTATTEFLLDKDEAEKYELVVKPTATSNDQYIAVATDGSGEINLTVNKGLSAVELIPELPATWTAFSRTGWVATSEGTTTYGSAPSVLDGSQSSDIDGSNFAIILDMLETRSMGGMGSRYYGSGNSSYYPRNVKFYISDDGTAWTQIGNVDIPNTGSIRANVGHNFRFLSTLSARYVKFEVSGGTTWLAELLVYEAVQ